MTASPREGACEHCGYDGLLELRLHNEIVAENKSLRAALGEENDLLLELRKHRSVHRFAADRIDKLNEKARALGGKP
jgi:hypothetical protein